MRSAPSAAQSPHQLFQEDLLGQLGSLRKHELILESTGNEMECAAPCDPENPHVARPGWIRKTLSLWGKEPGPAQPPWNPHSGFRKQQAEQKWLNLVVFLFLSSHKYRQKTENDSFPS